MCLVKHRYSDIDEDDLRMLLQVQACIEVSYFREFTLDMFVTMYFR